MSSPALSPAISPTRHIVELDGPADPVLQVARLASSGLFSRYVAYERDGTWWFAGGELASVVVYADRVIVRQAGSEEVTPIGPSPVQAAGQALARIDRVPWASWRAYGWATFELAYAVAAPGLLTGDERIGAEPLLHLMVPSTEIELRPTGTVVSGSGHVDVDAVATVLGTGATLPAVRDGATPPAPLDLGRDGDAYRAAVAAAVGRIRAGDLEKVILSRSLELPDVPDFAATYVTGRRANNPARSFLLELGGWRAAGFSPEIVVEVDTAGRVRTEPLAGTRRCEPGPAGEAAYRELATDPKEVHEHAISVRQSFDELLTVCDPSTVAVREFMQRKERGAVQHLGSTVTGNLCPGRTCWDAFERLFPAVTASGIPKVPAFEQIAALETERRGLYAGAVLQVGNDGSLDAALVLRTLLARDGRAWLRAGAGVVTSSRPERELTETVEKLSSVAPHVVTDRP